MTEPLRIGILTYHFSDNFGALLQAYGTKTWLQRQGHSVEFINYHPTHVEEGGDFVRLFNPRFAKVNAKILYLKLSTLQRHLFGNRQQAEGFEAFRRAELGMRGERMFDKQDVDAFLRGLDKPYDVIVVGSDQIWSPSQQKGLDPVYFADLTVGTKTRRIAYGPSFGRATLDPAYAGRMRELLGNLDGISARERSGVEIIRQLIGREVACVPDPTILLGDYRGAISSAEETPRGHVFCYALRSGQGIREIAEWVGGALKADVLSPYNVHRRWKEIGRTVYPSPKGWLAMADRAGFVVTNSFHGTVFSILLQRPFLVAGLPGNKAALNERSLNLLKELGLGHRFVPYGEMETARARFAEAIDWDSVTPRLAALQEAGRSYLADEIAKTAAR